MLGKLIPIVLAVAGLGAGVGAGIALRPHDEPAHDKAADNPCGDPTAAAMPPQAPEKAKINGEFVNLSNQFVFPLVEGGAVAALVVLSLTLEVTPGQTDAVYLREPKLRDGFLRVLLDHANSGGFNGAFTANSSMDKLRNALLEKGREDLGMTLIDVLILDINRQDN